MPQGVLAAHRGGVVQQQEFPQPQPHRAGLLLPLLLSYSQSTSVVEQVQQMRAEPEVVQGEAELPNDLRYVGLQHSQQDTVQGGHGAQPSKLVYGLLAVD